MLKIRLQRVGRKHIPIFRVVLTDSRNSTKSGKFKEVLGTYNHTTEEKRVDAERVKYWLSKGAKPSDTMHNFLVSERIIEGKKINVLPRKRPVQPKDKAGGTGAAVEAAKRTAGAPAEEAAPEAKAAPSAAASESIPAAPEDLSTTAEKKEEAPNSDTTH